MMAYLTPQEIADRWRCNRQKIYDLLNRGQLKGFKIGSDWRIREKDLIDYEENGYREPVIRPQRRIITRIT